MPPFKTLSYSMDSSISKVRIESRKLKVDNKKLEEVIVGNCPFELPEVIKFEKTKFGFEIELYQTQDELHNAKPYNVIYIK